MLEPNNRFTLVEVLRPPDDYELSWALGTSFTLDLISALICPLSFAMFDWEDDEGKARVDPHALLESLRRYADRMSIFCQAGQISVPPASQALLPYLEGSIIEANAPTPGHIFHPKLWILRFESKDGSVRYRVLCLTRNLTFDRCWDAGIILEGDLTDRERAHAASHPLGDFVASLPGMARDKPLPKAVSESIERIQREVRRVSFEIPEPFDDYMFWPLGLPGGGSWPFEGRIDRLMAISPYIEPRALARLTDRGERHLLISRIESLQALPGSDLDAFETVYVLSDSADVEAQGQPDEVATEDVLLRGLHAKIYVAEAGGSASVFSGSANATNAAFGGNVEFLVELMGTKGRCGVGAILGSEEAHGMAQLLERYEPESQPKVDEVGEALQRRADDIRYEIARAPLLARVMPDEHGESYTIRLETLAAQALTVPPGAVVRCWPARQAEGSAVTIKNEASVLATFSKVATVALTSFFVFEVTVSESKRKLSIRFTLNVPLDGAPADRLDRLLADMLKDKDQVLRFLLFLLGDAASDPASSGLLVDLVGGSDDSPSRELEVPLFETLIRTLSRAPERLDQVASLIESLRKTADGPSRIPDGFASIWEPIWATRREMIRG